MAKRAKKQKAEPELRDGSTKIKMSKTCKGQDCTEKGVHDPLKVYEEGKVYRVGSSLCKTFCDDLGVAKKAPLGKAENKKDDSSESSS